MEQDKKPSEADLLQGDATLIALFQEEHDPPSIEDAIMLDAMTAADGEPQLARQVYTEMRRMLNAMSEVARRKVDEIETQRSYYQGVTEVARQRIDNILRNPQT